MLTYFRINYLTNLTYFPIFPQYVDFSKVAAASPLAAAADRAMLCTKGSMKLKYSICKVFFNLEQKKCVFINPRNHFTLVQLHRLASQGNKMIKQDEVLFVQFLMFYAI